MSANPLTVVIPTLNESVIIADSVSAVRAGWPEAGVVVADGNSSDDTVALAETAGATTISVSTRSRGTQLNEGARTCDSDWILFLHADTRLTPEAIRAADSYMKRDDGGLAMFRIQFKDPTWMLRFSAWWTRFDSVFTRFGDQGILIRRSFFLELGGFNTWPLFEDVNLVRRARARHRIDVLPASVVTSSRRFRRYGPLRQQLRNGRLLIQFLGGADPHRLARSYPVMKD
jgi:rSAM/selenodomain-associated transferase 2